MGKLFQQIFHKYFLVPSQREKDGTVQQFFWLYQITVIAGGEEGSLEGHCTPFHLIRLSLVYSTKLGSIDETCRHKNAHIISHSIVLLRWELFCWFYLFFYLTCIYYSVLLGHSPFWYTYSCGLFLLTVIKYYRIKIFIFYGSIPPWCYFQFFAIMNNKLDRCVHFSCIHTQEFSIDV